MATVALHEHCSYYFLISELINSSLGVKGPGEKPSWGETRLSGTGGSHPGQESW